MHFEDTSFQQFKLKKATRDCLCNVAMPPGHNLILLKWLLFFGGTEVLIVP
jgi:hypothetical protein